MEVTCNECKHIDNVESYADYVCPQCGSSEGFAMSVGVAEYVIGFDSVRSSSKTSGDKKPYLESWEGKDLHEASGQVRDVFQQVDRRGNRYRKRVIGPSGEVIKDENKPLTEKDGASAQRRYRARTED